MKDQSTSDRKLNEFDSLQLFQIASDAIFIFEMHDQQPSVFLEVNHKACDLSGFKRDELLKLTPLDILTPQTIGYINTFLTKQVEGTKTFEAILITKNGKSILINVSSRIAFINNRKIVMSIVRDLSEDKIGNCLIKYLAYYDTLTSLPNRRFITEQLPQELETAQISNTKLALIFINLDRFTLINDSFSYFIGDSILKEAAMRILNYVQGKGIAAHLGGDEFIVLLPLNDTKIITEQSNELLQVFENPFSVDDHDVYLTASIGISIYPDHDHNSSFLKRNANLAMLHSKERGGNQASIYHPNMDIPAYETLILQSDLHRAIIQEEFCLHYQPKIDTKTHKIIGAEALIRWEHPQQGMISPGLFIPMAEKSTMINDIGNWVLRTACRQIKTWQDEGIPPLQISINLSIRQFDDSNFVQHIKDVLIETGVEGNWLELEITESILVKDRDAVIDSLLCIKELGVKISIDDFGTGYSSLSCIHQLPIDCLKIDQSFIRDIHTNSKSNLVSSIIELGHNLHLTVVAEGVESIEQLDYLKQNNCDEWQGYLFSKPLPVEQFEKLFAPVHELIDL